MKLFARVIMSDSSVLNFSMNAISFKHAGEKIEKMIYKKFNKFFFSCTLELKELWQTKELDKIRDISAYHVTITNDGIWNGFIATTL